MQSKLKSYKNSGITLIALVVTIVVLLILAGITINMLFSENGIITKAREAAKKTAEAEKNEISGMENLVTDIDKVLYEVNSKSVTNPYDSDGWYLAWTCKDGTWSDEIEEGTVISEDVDIVAKLYKTGNKITPPDIESGEKTYTFKEGNEYVMVIEGQGEMGELIKSDETEAYAWQYSGLLFLGGYVDTCIIPYVTKFIVCDGITNIGAYACCYGGSLKEVEIGKDVNNIESYAMNTCVSLEIIKIPDNVTTIGDNVFFGCAKLKEIKLPQEMQEIGRQQFDHTSIETITLPKGITYIGDCMFNGCTNLKSIEIPDSVISIGGFAFADCTNLKNIQIPDGVISIGGFAFADCTRLTNIIIPNSVTEIDGPVFSGCSNLVEITLSKGITALEQQLFEQCSSLAKLTMEGEITKFYSNAFTDCNNLKTIKLLMTTIDNIEFMNYDAFYKLPENSTIYVLNETVKVKIESACDLSKTTVQVVTLEQMNNL